MTPLRKGDDGTNFLEGCISGLVFSIEIRWRRREGAMRRSKVGCVHGGEGFFTTVIIVPQSSPFPRFPSKKKKSGMSPLPNAERRRRLGECRFHPLPRPRTKDLFYAPPRKKGKRHQRSPISSHARDLRRKTRAGKEVPIGDENIQPIRDKKRKEAGG